MKGRDLDAMLLAQGQQLINVGRYEDALPLLTRAIAAQPESAEARCELAFALLRLGRREAALKQAEAAAALEPNYERPHRLRSVILDGLGRRKDALAAAEVAVRLAPEVREVLYTLGSAQLDVKKIRDAQATAEQLVRLAPGWTQSHLLLGQVALRMKKWRLGEDANRRALQIDPTNNAALNNLGAALQGQHRWREALETYQRAAQLDPSDPIAKGNLVRLVRPVSGRQLAIDAVRAIAIPWSIPIVLVRLTYQFIRSDRRRAQLGPGARLYYDRESRLTRFHLERVLAAVVLFILGYAGLAAAQLLGLSFVATGIPVAVLFFLCLGVAVSGLLLRACRDVGRWWRTRFVARP